MSPGAESSIIAFRLPAVEGYLDKTRKKNSLAYRLKEAVLLELKKAGLVNGRASVRLKKRAINEKDGYFIFNLAIEGDGGLAVSVYGSAELLRRVGRPYARVKFARAVAYRLPSEVKTQTGSSE